MMQTQADCVKQEDSKRPKDPLQETDLGVRERVLPPAMKNGNNEWKNQKPIEINDARQNSRSNMTEAKAEMPTTKSCSLTKAVL